MIRALAPVALLCTIVAGQCAASSDADEAVALLTELMGIESTTGLEQGVVFALRDWLEERGWTVELQEVAEDRPNLFAHRMPVGFRTPRLVFNSHTDTVPPYIAPTVDETVVRGRGACDAKGQIVSQVFAAQHLVETGKVGPEDIALLYVVGEEVDHSGMKAANELGIRAEALVCGEPTESLLGLGHKGMLRFFLRSSGQPGHSGYPEEGKSAIDPLVDLLAALKAFEWPVDDRLGPTTLNIGVIRGGAAGNVIPESAEAEITVRVSTSVDEVRRAVLSMVSAVNNAGGEIEYEETVGNDPVTCATVPGFDTISLSYGTDIPYLDGPHDSYLMGPGTILVAHTDFEFIDIVELAAHIGKHQDLALAILAKNDAEAGDHLLSA